MSNEFGSAAHKPRSSSCTRRKPISCNAGSPPMRVRGAKNNYIVSFGRGGSTKLLLSSTKYIMIDSSVPQWFHAPRQPSRIQVVRPLLPQASAKTHISYEGCLLWTRLRHGFPSACLISLVQSVSCVYSSPAQHPHIARTSPTHRPHIARCRKPRDLRMMHTENSGPANPLPLSDALRRSNVFLQRAMCGRCAGDVRAMAGDGNNHMRHPPRNAGGRGTLESIIIYFVLLSSSLVDAANMFRLNTTSYYQCYNARFFATCLQHFGENA